MSPGTIFQIETFHKWLISDLFKRNKDINYDKCLDEANFEKTKKYYLVPLKIKKQSSFEDVEMDGSKNFDPSKITQYEIDYKLLTKVERLATNGYKNE